ncbi:uncharacterized protein LOC122521327 isoform X1 [Polistes fuscatus]|uniref:uncharacterized protein LOC122521327 isoform X1 n=2 Tax=Polistes fuscatus TaxID=30207 RepID=UPI001CA98CCC|nr:uncharacterized protein LOC122521327 isoform X1 [Polistes fuscatus]
MKYNNVDFLGYAVLTFTLHLNAVRAEDGVACKDLQGRSYETGYLYFPGPEPCTFCVCDNGNPKWCKAVICKFLEEDCKSMRRSEKCCEFICLNDANEKSDGSGTNLVEGSVNYDIGLRSVASFVTAILSLSLLFFLIYRLRQRKIRDSGYPMLVCVAGRQSRQLAEDQRNLGSMGYLERGGLQHGIPMDDIPCGGGYPLWKPANNYFPRGEAPPPYEEAVAAARTEQALLSMTPHTTLSPLNFSNGYLQDTNSHPNIAVVANSQDALNSTSAMPSNSNGASTVPLVSSSNVAIGSLTTYTNCHQLNQSEQSTTLNVGTSTATNYAASTNTYENLPVSTGITNFTYQIATASNDTQPLTSSHSTISKSYRQHTTFPRQSGAFTISASLPSSDISAHRTIPRTLTNNTPTTRIKDIMSDRSTDEIFHLPPRSLSPKNLPQSPSPIVSNDQEHMQDPSNIFCKDVITSVTSVTQIERLQGNVASRKPCDFKPPLNIANEINEDGSFESVACTCSMQTLPTLHDDADDYRSECENCKSATGSRYYLDNEDELVTSPHETMTLHRRPEDTASSATPQYYRTSLTLPTSTRQRTRSTGVRENWFNTMPQSSTESSDEN